MEVIRMGWLVAAMGMMCGMMCGEGLVGVHDPSRLPHPPIPLLYCSVPPLLPRSPIRAAHPPVLRLMCGGRGSVVRMTRLSGGALKVMCGEKLGGAHDLTVKGGTQGDVRGGAWWCA